MGGGKIVLLLTKEGYGSSGWGGDSTSWRGGKLNCNAVKEADSHLEPAVTDPDRLGCRERGGTWHSAPTKGRATLDNLWKDSKILSGKPKKR